MKLKKILLLAVAVPLLCACSCQQRMERLRRSCPIADHPHIELKNDNILIF